MSSKSSSGLPIFAGIGLAMIWGFSFLFTKETLDHTFPLQLLGFRFGAAALLLTILKLTGLVRINLKGKPISSLLLLAFFQPGLYFIGETWGVKWTSASEAGMVIALVPVAIATMASILNLITIVSVFSGVFFRGEQFGWIHAVGITLIILGVWGTNIFSRTALPPLLENA